MRLFGVTERVLAAAAVFVSHDYSFAPDYSAQGDRLLRPAQSAADVRAKFAHTSGLAARHRGFVLLVWMTVGSAAALIGAAVLQSVSRYLLRDSAADLRPLLLTARALPFVCLAWAVAILLAAAYVNEESLHQSAGFGDFWHCGLPNG